jgi:hypothetical protein
MNSNSRSRDKHSEEVSMTRNRAGARNGQSRPATAPRAWTASPEAATDEPHASGCMRKGTYTVTICCTAKCNHSKDTKGGGKSG